VNSNGFISARFDFTAFGEKISLGVGLRSIDQGYSAPANSRQGYGLTETDTATGLDHTWFRKNENRAGRWTSPDPYNGSMSLGSSQSFNRYSYVENQPTNFVDPSGLEWRWSCELYAWFDGTTGEMIPGSEHWHCNYVWHYDVPVVVTIDGGGGGGLDTTPTVLETTISQRPCIPGTVQIGVNASGVLGAITGTASAGIAIDGSGNIGLYADYGGGVGAGLRGGVGIQAVVTNANQIVDLRGPFANVSAGGGAGGAANVILTAGQDRNNSPVVGAGLAAQAGGGGGAAVTATNTHVAVLGNPLGGDQNGCH